MDEKRNLNSAVVYWLPAVMIFATVIGIIVFRMVWKIRAKRMLEQNNDNVANIINGNVANVISQNVGNMVEGNNQAVPGSDPMAQPQQIYLQQPEMQPAPVIVMVDPGYQPQAVNNTQQPIYETHQNDQIQPAMMQPVQPQQLYISPGP